MFQALRNRNVALLFSAQVVSLAGDLVLFVALPFWVFQLTGSAMATGIMFAALLLPQLVISPIAGVFVDRWDRKRLMIASDLVRAAMMLCYLFVNTADQVWMIYLIAFSEAAVTQFFRPAVNAVVPLLVEGEEELARANASLGASFAIGQLAGPALGGVLVAAFGPHAAALVDGATYLLSALFVVFMRVSVRERAIVQLTSIGHAIAEITRELGEGVQITVTRPILRAVFAAVSSFGLANGITNVLLVILINQIWHAGAQEFGWVITAQGLGGILGSLFVGAIAARVSPRAMMIGGGLLAGVLFATVINQGSAYVAIALMPFIGMCVVALDVGFTTLLQLGTEDANRGRVSALTQTANAASQLLAIGMVSLFADRFGVPLFLNLAGIFFIMGGVAGFFVPRGSASTVTAQATVQAAE